MILNIARTQNKEKNKQLYVPMSINSTQEKQPMFKLLKETRHF